MTAGETKPAFFYLATPYTNYRGGREAAYLEAGRVAAWLLKTRQVSVFSPIAHGHWLSRVGELDPGDRDLWAMLDAPFVELAAGLIICRMDGWEHSRGVRDEWAAFLSAKKPVEFIDPPPLEVTVPGILRP